jgi:hypothetical protein
MQELINRVMTESGVSQDQAEKAIHAVRGYLKEKLPHAMEEPMDHIILEGGSWSEAMKKSFKDTADDVREKMDEAFKDVSARTSEAVDQVREKLDDFFRRK